MKLETAWILMDQTGFGIFSVVAICETETVAQMLKQEVIARNPTKKYDVAEHTFITGANLWLGVQDLNI